MPDTNTSSRFRFKRSTEDVAALAQVVRRLNTHDNRKNTVEGDLHVTYDALGLEKHRKIYAGTDQAVLTYHEEIVARDATNRPIRIDKKFYDGAGKLFSHLSEYYTYGAHGLTRARVVENLK